VLIRLNQAGLVDKKVGAISGTWLTDRVLEIQEIEAFRTSSDTNNVLVSVENVQEKPNSKKQTYEN